MKVKDVILSLLDYPMDYDVIVGWDGERKEEFAEIKIIYPVVSGGARFKIVVIKS